MGLKNKLPIYWFLKLIILGLIFFVGQSLIPYAGNFPYLGFLEDYHLPKVIYSLANFDGIHYLLIARDGYYHYEQAFFPLYPLMIKVIAFLFKNHLLVGLFISNLCFIISLYLLAKLIPLLNAFKKGRERSILLWLLIYPTSFFFHTYYTESLFLLLFLSSVYYLKKEHLLLAGLFATLASLTRLIGVGLVIPFAFYYWENRKKIKPWFVFVPFLGLFIYMFYLYFSVGDPLFFLNSQPAFGANRSTHLILLPQVYWRYLKIFWQPQFSFPVFVSCVEFFLFNLVAIFLIFDLKNWWQKKNYFLISLNLFSFLNLILPTATGTLSSIPRYSLFSISFLFFLGQQKSTLLTKILVAFFCVLQAVLFAFFMQGYFVS